MNIYFDYDHSVHNNIISKYLSRLLMRIKGEIHRLLEDIIINDMRNEQSPLDGYILITIRPTGYSKKVFGFSEAIREKITSKLKGYDLDQTVRNIERI